MNGYEIVQRQKWEKREREQAAIDGRRLGAIAALRIALVDAGAEKVESGQGTIDRVNGEYVSLGVGNDRNGKLRISWGPYGDRRQRPEPKRGFDFERIAFDLIETTAAWKVQRAKKKAHEEARGAAAAEARRVNEILNEEFSLGERIVRNPAEPFAVDRVNLRLFVRDCDEATARRVLAAVQKALEEV